MSSEQTTTVSFLLSSRAIAVEIGHHGRQQFLTRSSGTLGELLTSLKGIIRSPSQGGGTCMHTHRHTQSIVFGI